MDEMHEKSGLDRLPSWEKNHLRRQLLYSYRRNLYTLSHSFEPTTTVKRRCENFVKSLMLIDLLSNKRKIIKAHVGLPDSSLRWVQCYNNEWLVRKTSTDFHMINFTRPKFNYLQHAHADIHIYTQKREEIYKWLNRGGHRYLTILSQNLTLATSISLKIECCPSQSFFLD